MSGAQCYLFIFQAEPKPLWQRWKIRLQQDQGEDACVAGGHSRQRGPQVVEAKSLAERRPWSLLLEGALNWTETNGWSQEQGRNAGEDDSVSLSTTIATRLLRVGGGQEPQERP